MKSDKRIKSGRIKKQTGSHATAVPSCEVCEGNMTQINEAKKRNDAYWYLAS